MKPSLGYFHVRKEDVHARSASEANPPFESFDVVLRRDPTIAWAYIPDEYAPRAADGQSVPE